METIRYDYKPKLIPFLLAGLFFAGCGVVLAKEALGNDRGMIINQMIELDTNQATILLRVLVGACVVFVAGALFGIVRSFGAAQEVVLDPRALSAPKGGTSRTIVTVRYADVDDCRIINVKSQKFLVIRHRGGKLTINRAMLPSDDAFDQLVKEVSRRCLASRPR